MQEKYAHVLLKPETVLHWRDIALEYQSEWRQQGVWWDDCARKARVKRWTDSFKLLKASAASASISTLAMTAALVAVADVEADMVPERADSWIRMTYHRWARAMRWGEP